MTDKRAVRSEARERLRAITAAERARAGDQLATRIWTLPELAEARRILLYASIPEEVPTDAIAAEASRRGIQLVYPRCLPDSLGMALHLLLSPDDLVGGGRYGIREPAADCEGVAPSSIDVALVPGLGWDRRGHRLGRGAGYYDRLLSSPDWTGLRVGIFFASQEFDALPDDPWDMRLDLIVTEKEVVRVGAPEAGERRG